ncbi:DNA replication complex GINS protein PSF1-like [Cylas formicarius]|uniref:DNA replication complex GINS protein PSF1-like n=1 Tax=Cylas formicarius TaxID=197179 RepID=UPI00295875DE|nr:DNA replication complex GINS protein PSF1-like [Cylas formicarius]
MNFTIVKWNLPITAKNKTKGTWRRAHKGKKEKRKCAGKFGRLCLRVEKMYAEKACNLIKELARSEEVLAPYNVDLVKDVANEIKELHAQNIKDGSTIFNESGAVGTSANALYPTLRIGNAALKRNVRCFQAYHYNRLRKIRTMRWEFGSILPPDIKTNLSNLESEWFSKYSRTLANYMRSIGEDGLNLAINFKPPKALYIEVRCLLDYGKYELSDGTVVLLKKDSRHYLPRSECEELIRQGVIQHIV